jgi:tripartite-type tricarboxylate transporter receptor subunit TctC
MPSVVCAQPVVQLARIVVGFPPAGSADALARALSRALTGYAGTVVVENRAGAGGRLAMEFVKSSAADGSTMIMAPDSMLTLYPHVYRKLSYDPLHDFVAVSSVASFDFWWVVGPAVPPEVLTLRDFLTWAKANPKLATYGTAGAGSVPHFVGAMLGHAAGVDLTHVPYKGGAPALQDVMGGQVAAMVAGVASLTGIQAGKLRALATSGARRSAALPAVPTLAESGFKDIEVEESFGLYVPAKTPREVVGKLNSAVSTALKSKELVDVIARAGFTPGGESPQEFSEKVKLRNQRWAGAVRSTGFVPEE